MDWSMPGFPVLNYLLEFAQTHVHYVGDAILPSYAVTLFFSCFQSLPTSGYFAVSWHFSSGSQSIQLSSVTQLYLTFCSPMDCSMPGFPVCNQLSELAQIHVHWVNGTVQPSHPPALNLSQHQGLFHWVIFLYQVAKVLELQLQHQSFQWIFRADFLQDWLV